MSPRHVALAALIVSSCSNPRSSVLAIVADHPDEAPAAPKQAIARLIVTAPARPPRRRPAPDAALEPLLDELRKANGVGGAAIGFAHQESTFHRVAGELLPKADRKLLEWLAEDDHPTLRALGFAGLAALGERETLLRHVCDRELVEVCPGGCICGGQSIGAIAQEYLWSPAWLGANHPSVGSSPLLSPRERTALAFRIAAADACSLGEGATGELKRLGGNGWSWTEVRAATPDVPAWIVVKALSRFDREGALPLLVAVLDDATMPARARLAAASGMTLSTAEEADAALMRQSAFLDAARKGLAAELREVIRMRRKAEELLAPLDSAHTWMETEKLASHAIDAYAIRHPLVLGLVSTGSYGARDPDVNRARGDALLWTSHYFAAHEDCWSAYRDVAYALESRLDGEWSRESLAEALPAKKLAVFEANIVATTARLDRDVSCLD